MIKFGTGGWRAIIGDEFTKNNIQRVGTALAMRMKEEGAADQQVVIGYDRRFLSREAAIWLSEAIAGQQIRVRFINLSAPTPQIMFSVKHFGLPYGAAITASHNPAVYNGIKLFTSGGRDAVQSITDAIAVCANALTDDEILTVPFDEACKSEWVTFIDPRDEYIDSILSCINIEAIRSRRPRIALDPMYGVSLTGLMTILYTSRCDINVINERHDAFFGGHMPAPSPETLYDLQHAVTEHNADLGIATDGDADRLGVIDEKGRYVSANEILVLLYHYLMKYKGLRGAVVRNLATTHLLDKVAARFGQRCIEVPVGFKHISSGMEENDALIGGESSGGLTVRGHIRGKDGLYAASLLVEMLSVTGKKLSELLNEVYTDYGELHMAEQVCNLTPDLKEQIHHHILEQKELPDFDKQIIRVNYTDGCKVYFDDDSWVIMRFSGTEPCIRIFAEAFSEEEAKRLIRIFSMFAGITPS